MNAAMARTVALAAYAILVLQQLVDAWYNDMPWLLWLVKLLPLLVFLPWMLRDNLRAYIWLCFFCLFFFIRAVERIFAQPDSLSALTALVAVVVLFCSAMLYVRWRARELRAITDRPDTETEE